MVFGLIVFVAFDGRAFSEVPCATSSCFQSRNLEAATALTAALVAGTWIGTRLESYRFRILNERGLTVARGTHTGFYGQSSREIADFIDNLPSDLTPEKIHALSSASDSGEVTREAMINAFRSTFSTGQALALELYVERAQTTALARLNELGIFAEGLLAESVLRAIALYVAKDYMSWTEFRKSWRQYEAVFGIPRGPGPLSWQA